MTVDHTSRAAQVTPVPVAVTSADGVALVGVHLSRRSSPRGTALVVAHAFTHHTRHPTTRRVLAALATAAPVVALDMRGHGRSGGRNTVGDDEPLDLDAAVATARALATSAWPPSASRSAQRWRCARPRRVPTGRTRSWP